MGHIWIGIQARIPNPHASSCGVVFYAYASEACSHVSTQCSQLQLDTVYIADDYEPLYLCL